MSLEARLWRAELVLPDDRQLMEKRTDRVRRASAEREFIAAAGVRDRAFVTEAYRWAARSKHRKLASQLLEMIEQQPAPSFWQCPQQVSTTHERAAGHLPE